MPMIQQRPKLTTSLRHWRPYQLLRTSIHILRQDGLSRFSRRLMAWLKGSRRYYRRTFSDLKYQKLHDPTTPTADILAHQHVESTRWTDGPQFSIVTAVYNPTLPIFQEVCASIRAQSYPHWQWQVVDASTDRSIWKFLTQQAAKDPRIRPQRLEANGGISVNTNVALHAATGNFIVMFDHDDTIPPDALYEVAAALHHDPQLDFIYSDTDKLDESGRCCEPFFKPDWSPEMMLSCNVLCQLSVFRRSWLDQVGYLNPDRDGAQDWDLYLRITECTSHVHHIQKVLYHWRKTPQSTAQTRSNKSGVHLAQQAAILDHLTRTGLQEGQVVFDPDHFIHRFYALVTWKPSRSRRISIVIPSKDMSAVLSRCLSTLFALTTYTNYEVILVDTGSVDEKTWALYEQYTTNGRFRVVNYSEPFNFSKACNFGASYADGELILFLNNDTEILHGDWLDLMAQWFERPQIGIVGAKLLYPGGRLQHAGVILGMGGLAAHLYQGEPENVWGIFGSDGWYRNMSAVTAACLLISREAYTAVGGFDEAYLLNYSDVELCLRVREAGYRIVYTPQVRLIHRESVSHQSKIPRADFERADHRWQAILTTGDPYFNPNLSYRNSVPQLKDREEDTAAFVNRELMVRLPHKPIILLPDDLR